jgi:hypothetical protein
LAFIDLYQPCLIVSSRIFKFFFAHSSVIPHYFCILLFILATCRSQSDLYLLGFSSTGFTFSFSKISSLLLW